MTDVKAKRCQVCGKYTENLKTEEHKYLGVTFYYCEDCFKKLKKDNSTK
jgi:predicted SprT family Zn-dependent metalloprotease